MVSKLSALTVPAIDNRRASRLVLPIAASEGAPTAAWMNAEIATAGRASAFRGLFAGALVRIMVEQESH